MPKSPLNASKTLVGQQLSQQQTPLDRDASPASSEPVPPFTPGFSTNSAAPTPQVEMSELVTLHQRLFIPLKGQEGATSENYTNLDTLQTAKS